MILGRAVASDLDELVALEARAAAHPWSREVFAEELARDFSHVVTLREDGGELVAFIVYWHVADELSILDVATEPAQRRRGHAARLLQHALAYAREQRCARILLEVRQHNDPAKQLYKKHDFRPIALRAHYYADTQEDAIVMSRELETGGHAP